MDDEKEILRLKALYIHAKERDRQLWLVGGLYISYEEYLKRLDFIKLNSETK